MGTYFQQHLDYLFFVYGLAFVLVAAICAIIPKESARGAPWIWLGLFGLAHGFTEWLEIFAIDLKDTPVFSAARFAAMALSFVFLCEFARRTLGTLRCKGPGRWIYVPLLVLAASGGLGETASLQATTRYAFALIGGLWAAWALYQMEKKDERGRGLLAVAAIAMAGYAVAAGAIVPQAPFFPASVLNADGFSSVVGGPVQLFRAALAALLATALWMYSGRLRRIDMSQAENKGVPPLGYGLAIMLAVALVAGWRLAEFANDWSDGEVRDILQIQAGTAAAGFTPEELAPLSGTTADWKDANYRHLREQMQAVNHANPELRSAHLLVLRGGKILEAVSVDAKGAGRSEAGVAYERPPKELLEAFSPGKGSTLGPYHRDSGYLVSAFAPIRDPLTDAVAGVIGVDISADDWKLSVAEYRLAAIFITLLSVALIIYSFIVSERKWRLAQLAMRRESRIRRLSRVYALLSGINSLIVRVRDRDELFRETCRMAIEAGGFRMAWIGEAHRSAGVIKPVATAGSVGDFFDGAPMAVLESNPGGHGLTGRAIREMKPMISNNVLTDPQRMMKKELAERGINSLAIIPLIVGNEAVGVLALYAAEVGMFDQDEMRLLLELARDISFALDHIEKVERLNYLAYYDALTGLANRTLFLERVAQYMRSAVTGGHKLAVFILDLERFRNINDSLGRPAGDALLQQVAEFLSRNAEDPSILARLGGDHFAVVVPKLKQEGNIANLLEMNMRAFLDHTFRLNNTELRVPIKVGAALFPDDGTDAETLLQNAEAALKKAKASGDRYLFYTQKMTEMVAGKLTLENQLRLALDNGEFVLHYQPKVNLVSGKLTGAEALIRWNDPRTGLVPPGRFIPILEETGLIYDVGRWALRQAIADYLRWRNAGLPTVRIAVNVSPLQLRHHGFLAEIEQAIGIDAHAAAGLELEITESLIMEDIKHTITTLLVVRDMGVIIAIDDFGTGFSSLSYLAKLPVDTLKIDRSFVADMTSGPAGLALVSTVINLAHSLKLKVVAEGVETEEQSHLLRLLNCDEMQGFLFSKPVPSAIFEEQFLVALSAV